MRPHRLSFRSVRRGFSLAVVLAGTAAHAPSRAQTIPSAYSFIERRHEAGFFVGALSSDRGPRRLAPEGGPLVGARYGIRLTGPLTLEVAGFMAMSEREVYDPEGTGGPTLLGVTEARPVGVEARMRLDLAGARTWHRLAPFVLGGAGVVSETAGDSPLEIPLVAGERFSFGPAPLLTAGAGTRWFPTDRLSVRIEGLFHLWRVTTPSAFLEVDPDGSVGDRRWVRSLGLTAGMHLGF